VPPRVEYSITEKGEELSSLLDNMCKFSETIHGLAGVCVEEAK
jgi:DNA-binding HxlR family transcriptional regulator